MPRLASHRVYHAKELDLVAAILRQAVADALCPNPAIDGTGHRPLSRAVTQRDAQDFLRDRARVALYAELCGVEVETLQPRLLQAAGLYP